MTVLDFRPGGQDGVRGMFDRGDHEGHAQMRDWHAQDWAAQDGSAQDWQSQDWIAENDWADARSAGHAGSGRLTDRDSVLGRVARLTHYLGAVVSVVLMIALGVWGYKLVVRDVSGVPVIRAVQGDARTVPEEPGGKLTDRTGLAVNEIAAGRSPTTAEKVAIAPAPTGLDSNDVAMGELGATARQPDGVSELPLFPPVEPTVALTDAEAAAQATATEDGAAEMTAAAPEPDTPAPGAAAQDSAIDAALAEAAAPPIAAGRPAPRPQRLAARAVESAGTTRATGAAGPASPPASAPFQQARVASGAPLVQIGAFDSDAIAQSEWTRVSGRFGALFAGKAPIVQQHQANGRIFYRLRVAGFESRDDARRFCAALIEAGTDCIPAAAP